MSWHVLVRPEAERDLAIARDWDEEQARGLGGQFLGEFAAAVVELEKHPERTPFYYRAFRRVLFRRFPDKVFLPSDRRAGDRLPGAHAKQAHETHFHGD